LQAAPAAGRQTLFQSLQVASRAQFASVPHSGVQYPAPWASLAQCCGWPSGAAGQSRSCWHGAQYARGSQTVRVGPKLGVTVVTLGAWLTVAHHHPPGHSESLEQPSFVQKAFASVGELP
jgi:hypothetical protein